MSRALLACVAAAAAAAAGAPGTASKAVRGAQGQFNDAGSITGRSMATTPLVTFNAPAMGSDVPVTGTVTGLPSAATNFKVGILVSADGTIWWDKTHDYPNGVPNTNPIEGILLDANGAFTITGWVSDPNDKVAPFMRVVCVPTSFSFLWPGYQVEGVAWPLNFFNPNTVTAMTTANRQTGAVANWLPSNGAGLPALPGAGGGTAPAASPSAAAAASPSSAPAAASPSSAPAAASPSSAAAAPSNAATGSGPVVTISIPAMGTNTAVTGKVTGLPSAPTNFKIGILVSADGTIWWDKTHDYPNGSPAGTVIGIPIDATGAFTITGWVSDPHDEIAPYMRVLCVPTSFSFLWPAYQVEGVAWPLNFFNPNTVTAMVSVYRPTGAVLNWLPSNGAGLPALPGTGGGTAPAASPSAAAAASPAAASPAAAASPSSAAAAASPSAPAAPAASPSAAAAAPSTNAQPSSNALPNASPSSAPAGASGLPASGSGNATATSGAVGSHAVSALLGGVVAAVAAGVALLA